MQGGSCIPQRKKEAMLPKCFWGGFVRFKVYNLTSDKIDQRQAWYPEGGAEKDYRCEKGERRAEGG